MWKPMFVEGSKALKSLEEGTADAMPLTEDDRVKVCDLVEMLTDIELLKKYPTDSARATVLEMELPYYKVVKNTAFFKKVFLQAIKAKSLELMGKSMEALASSAQDPTNRNSVRAFEQLRRLALDEEKKAEKKTPRGLNIGTLNITFEQQIKETLKQRFIDEPGGGNAPNP